MISSVLIFVSTPPTSKFIEEWIPEDDIVHFIIGAAELVPMSEFHINHKGTGKAQYHPQMMLALLLYCYSHGFFSSRKIERATYTDQINMTDSDSRIMRKNNRSEYSQSYNAQAVVDAEGSQLVVGARVKNAGTDRNELVENIDSIPEEVGKSLAMDKRDGGKNAG